jgi:hypothetical protein
MFMSPFRNAEVQDKPNNNYDTCSVLVQTGGWVFGGGGVKENAK